ncbi:glycosyltransferase family 2 protein [bacterium]|nr:glycosyltransferase family 2 protein [bacterium]
MLDLSIIIVNYNSGILLADCLESIYKTSSDIPFEISVVDNASAPGDLDDLSNRFPSIKIIKNLKNLGFAKANNQAIKKSSGRYILLLNPDTAVIGDAIRQMKDYLENDTKAGAAGPKILNSDGSLQFSCRRFPTFMTAIFNRYSLLSRVFPDNRFSRDYLMSGWDHNEVRMVDWVSGCCIMVKRAVVSDVGPLDEEFFMFNEDVDWCLRMKKAGYGIAYLPQAKVMHHIGASSGNASKKLIPRLIIERHKGMIHFLKKHNSRNPFVYLIAKTAVYIRMYSLLFLNNIRQHIQPVHLFHKGRLFSEERPMS